MKLHPTAPKWVGMFVADNLHYLRNCTDSEIARPIAKEANLALHFVINIIIMKVEVKEIQKSMCCTWHLLKHWS